MLTGRIGKGRNRMLRVAPIFSHHESPLVQSQSAAEPFRHTVALGCVQDLETGRIKGPGQTLASGGDAYAAFSPREHLVSYINYARRIASPQALA